MDIQRIRRNLPAVCIVVLFFALTLQTGWFIGVHSNTFDEPPIIGAGISYVKTGRIELESQVYTPLIGYLIGLSVNTASPTFQENAQSFRDHMPYKFGCEFLYHNSVPPEILLALARLPGLILSLAMAAVLCHWAGAWFGPWGSVAALALYAFEPNLIAHSGLAGMDIGLSAFLFMASYFLVSYLDKPERRRLVLGGILAGCAVAAKLPGLFFLVWSSAWSCILTPRSVQSRTQRFLFAAKTNLVIFLLGAGTLAACYQFRFFPKFFGLIGEMFPVIFSRQSPEPHPAFVHGHIAANGFWYYYLVALAVKTSIPFLIACGLGAFQLNRKEKSIIAIPVISFLLICTFASKQNGIRYILPIFPFLCLAGAGCVRLRMKRAPLLIAGLLAWAAGEAVAFAPHYLSYFNEFAGGPQGGYRWLVDSNIDWGQDFTFLRSYLKKEGRPETIVASLDTVDRDYYLGPHQDLLAWSQEPEDSFHHLNSEAPRKELLIVSASFLQGYAISDPTIFSWLKDVKPYARVAYSLFVYDITRDTRSQFNIGILYMKTGRFKFAVRQFLRASAIEPENPTVLLALGDAYRFLGQNRNAEQTYRASLRKAVAQKMPGLSNALRNRLSSPLPQRP